MAVFYSQFDQYCRYYLANPGKFGQFDGKLADSTAFFSFVIRPILYGEKYRRCRFSSRVIQQRFGVFRSGPAGNDSQDSMVAQHNDLIRARYDMSLLESRLFVCLLGRIDRKDKNFVLCRIPVSELYPDCEQSPDGDLPIQRRFWLPNCPIQQFRKTVFVRATR
jgi:hypothetical protein